MIAGSVIPPLLVIKAQGRSTQSDLFARIATNAPTLEDVLNAFQADPTTILRDPEPNHTISSWSLLPVPAKFACLFLKGLSLTEGFLLGCALLQMMPDQFANEKEEWSNFLRSAATWRTIGEETSALTTTWVCKDPYVNGALTNWYFALLAQVTGPSPRTAQAAPAQAAPAYAANAHAAMAHAASPHVPPVPLLGPGVDGDGQRADITMMTMDLLQAMTERLAGGASASRSTTKNYDWVELEYLFQRIGAPQINGGFTGLGPESLPEFFQSLATARGKKANTRLFAERYRSTHYPAGAVEYDFVWTMQLLKDLKSLSFSGDYLVIAYPNRFRGMSVFSLAPISESSMAAGASMRQRMLHFETTESNHLPTDALEMATLSTTGTSILGTCAETQAWIDHVGIMTRMIMGDACPLNRALDAIRACLQKPHLFPGWSETEWKAFVWASHVAYRAFMCDMAMTPLAQIAADLDRRIPPEMEADRNDRANRNLTRLEWLADSVTLRRTVWLRISRPCWLWRNQGP
jgi:hypothetical protein